MTPWCGRIPQPGWIVWGPFFGSLLATALLILAILGLSVTRRSRRWLGRFPYKLVKDVSLCVMTLYAVALATQTTFIARNVDDRTPLVALSIAALVLLAASVFAIIRNYWRIALALVLIAAGLLGIAAVFWPQFTIWSGECGEGFGWICFMAITTPGLLAVIVVGACRARRRRSPAESGSQQ
jgi:hypothetical protein